MCLILFSLVLCCCCVISQVFAVACRPNYVKLYDTRSYDQGPFATFLINPTQNDTSQQEYEWDAMKFSPDGQFLLMANHKQQEIILIDSFEGVQVKQYIQGKERERGTNHPTQRHN